MMPEASPTTDWRSFEDLDEGRYLLESKAGLATLEVDYLRRQGGQLKAELLVRCQLAGARTFDGDVLSISDINLSSARTRSMHARHLADRARTGDEVDWVGLLEELAVRVLAAEREGQPAVLLHGLQRPEPDPAFEVDGLELLASHPLVLFGDGGTTKSYLALYFVGKLAQAGQRVGFFDWELTGEDHRERLELLFGADMPEVYYVRCAQPLAVEVERLRRVVREARLDYFVCDSVAPACDGPPEAAEVASRYFQAVRRLGPIGSLHIAHVTKTGDHADQRPFGSAFWANLARATWNAKLADTLPGEDRVSVALHNRKANLGARRPSVGFELRFAPDRTQVRRIDLARVPDLAADLPIRHRMALALQCGPLTVESLAAELETKADTVRRTANRYKKQFTLLQGGRLALLSERDEP